MGLPLFESTLVHTTFKYKTDLLGYMSLTSALIMTCNVLSITFGFIIAEHDVNPEFNGLPYWFRISVTLTTIMSIIGLVGYHYFSIQLYKFSNSINHRMKWVTPVQGCSMIKLTFFTSKMVLVNSSQFDRNLRNKWLKYIC